MPEEFEQLTVTIEGYQDADDMELDDLTRQLRQRLLSLAVESVDRLSGGVVPLGARSVDALTFGALTVTVSPALIRAVVGVLEAWRRSRPVRRITLTGGKQGKLVLEGASEADMSHALEAFLSRF
jgi:hypothetical protein